ncbi:MAG: hypothetical protein V4850_33390 [Myxococcota bacterium]
MTRARPVLVLALLTALPAFAGNEEDVCADPGASSVFAMMPVAAETYQPTGPTYPEGVAIVGDRVIVSGPANFGTAGNGSPSQLTVFDLDTGALRAVVPVVGEDLSQEHALSELATRGHYAYAPSTQLGVLRWKFNGHHDSPTQESVSTPFCSVTGEYPCHDDSNACPDDVRAGLPPLPNGIAVASDGVVYVTDSLQGIVWRVDAHGGGPVEPEVLYCSAALQGSGDSGLGLFGANGIAVAGDDLYVVVTFGAFDALGPTSTIYRLDREDPLTLELVYTYSGIAVAPGVVVPPIADGLRYDAETNHLLVVLGGQNAVSELDLGGAAVTEVARYTRTDADTPFLNPSTIALGEGGTAYVSNHAITCCLDGDPNPACGCYGAEDYFGVIEICRE